jgi:hypothetical protein
VTSGFYFFLSYEHQAPLTGQRPEELDRWVRSFFERLCEAVDGRAVPGSGRRAGFADFDVPVGADWNRALLDALGATEVFVPLYSPNYFARTRPRRELESFRRRMTRAQVPADGRVVPALWTPPLGSAGADWAQEALAVTGAVPGYAENGLQALLRLDMYNDVFDQVLGLLADRIVEIAETRPVAHSSAEAPDDIALPSQDAPVTRRFAVTVAAGDPDWRPFADQARSLAEYAEDVASRFDFVVDTFALTDGTALSGSPGIVLIDPEHLARPGRSGPVEAALADRPPWVLPLVVGTPEAVGNALSDGRLRDSLASAEVVRRDVAARADRGVLSLQEFVGFMPFLVTEAERLYLRYNPMPQPAPDKPGSMPRLDRPPTQREGGR